MRGARGGRRVIELLPRSVRGVLARIRRTSAGRRLLSGSVWSAAGLGAARLGSLVGSVIPARVIGQSRFGAYAIVAGTAVVFNTSAGYALTLATSKHVSQYRHADPERAGRYAYLGLALGLASGLVLAGLLAVA